MHPHTWCMDIDDMHAYHALASMAMADLDGKRYDLYSAHASGGLFRFRWRFEIAACRTNPGIKKHDARGKTERKPPASALAHAWCTAPPCGGDGNDSLRRIRQMLQRIATGSQMLQRTATGRRQGGGRAPRHPSQFGLSRTRQVRGTISV